MAGLEARSRSQKPLESGFWLKPDPSAAFEAAEAAPRSRTRSRLLTSPNYEGYGGCTGPAYMALTSAIEYL
jgi:hypothetical protein